MFITVPVKSKMEKISEYLHTDTEIWNNVMRFYKHSILELCLVWITSCADAGMLMITNGIYSTRHNCKEHSSERVNAAREI